MTKRDYKMFASIFFFNRYTVEGCSELLDMNGVVEQLTIYFTQENPKFDKNKFKTACGL